MGKPIWAYGATAVVMIVLDLIWLGIIAKPLYQQSIGHLMADSLHIAPAALFYLLFPLGLVLFAVMPHVGAGKWSNAFLWGGLFGFFAYATYDLTNLATLKNWPLSIALIDMAWGSAVSGVASTAGYFAVQWAAKP
jgi:uncharacterized membrane protein